MKKTLPNPFPVGEYVAPYTTKVSVETEGGLCDSSKPASVEMKSQTIEVEEYVSIENDITFN